ncbi:hypothetical protein [Rhizobium sp. NXC24]|uniref:hypothetical protein n=1 Tax=Rhizobium sp. NXC24 TaxID=2048897 RepID=UPI00131A5400|nr:hypothetical protein [Rhizobium sp. NXC24]
MSCNEVLEALKAHGNDEQFFAPQHLTVSADLFKACRPVRFDRARLPFRGPGMTFADGSLLC